MTKLLKICCLYSLAFLSTSSFSIELTVEIKKVKQFEKKIMIELFLLEDKKYENWQNIQLIDKKIIELSIENQEVNFFQLKKGSYALRVFQDINNNGSLDKSSNNIPLEPIGFSTNPSLFKGEPSPKDSTIELINDKHILINLKHRKPKRKRKRHH